MNGQKCIGIDPSSGEQVEVSLGQTITAVEPLLPPNRAENYLSPGWIDVQVNGYAGVDYCSPTAPHDEIARSVRAMFQTGVTRFFPTVITGSVENMAGAIANLGKAKEALPLEGRAMEGFHIEGPYISAEDGPRGAHPRQSVRPPDIEELKRWIDLSGGNIKLITIAPEWPEACAYIDFAVRQGVVISIGHSGASAKQIADAVSAGATMSTHLGNGAHAMIRRHPNYIWDQLADDRLTASFIVDGIHLPEAFLRVALRAKGVERSVVVSDAVMPAGCPPGRYRLGEVDVELHADDRVTLVGQDKLAGSSLKMDRGLQNLMKMGLSLVEALAMATRNPARVCRIRARQRGLQPGERGDVVEFRVDPHSKAVSIVSVYMDGECVHRA
ncbi:MAG: amidohydrolase family protein [Bryobacteraceae bacterium]